MVSDPSGWGDRTDGAESTKTLEHFLVIQSRECRENQEFLRETHKTILNLQREIKRKEKEKDKLLRDGRRQYKRRVEVSRRAREERHQAFLDRMAEKGPKYGPIHRVIVWIEGTGKGDSDIALKLSYSKSSVKSINYAANIFKLPLMHLGALDTILILLRAPYQPPILLTKRMLSMSRARCGTIARLFFPLARQHLRAFRTMHQPWSPGTSASCRGQTSDIGISAKPVKIKFYCTPSRKNLGGLIPLHGPKALFSNR